MPTVAADRTLDATDRAAVRALAGRLGREVGAPPLNDEALARLGETDPRVQHLLVDAGGELAGYGQLRLSDGVADAELAGTAPYLDALLDAVDARVGHRTVRVWAHGQDSPVVAALHKHGYVQHRLLWQLRRNLRDLPTVELPSGVAVRAFVPGRDEDAWLAVNAAAFSAHAEQGGWTRRDLTARETEDWFDPAGFLLADRDGQLLGYHWTKVHRDRKGHAVGEVYVLGIAPWAQGMHLGRALLAAGLRYLADRGCVEVLLYVDDDNQAALRLYDSIGFRKHDMDVQFVRALKQ